MSKEPLYTFYTRHLWLADIAKRILSLEGGHRYQIIVTIYDDDKTRADWTVTQLGKIECAPEKSKRASSAQQSGEADKALPRDDLTHRD